MYNIYKHCVKKTKLIFTATKKIREVNKTLPILILSAKDREIDKVNGLYRI